MYICQDQRSGNGCGAQSPDGAEVCVVCGLSLRFAVHLADPGDTLGHYRVERVIGFGSFGAVYEALDTRPPERRVAIKESFEARTVRGFHREFDALAGLEHPNLPRYHEMFEVGGSGYMVMEFVPGQSLDEILERQNSPLSEQLIVAYAAQLCDLLSYLHGRNPPIIHRDIKPANIRITPDGVVKLVDFGLLKQGTRNTRQTVHGLGTLEYMPIEQFDWSGGTDQRSDIYSLGATLYHLLTNRWPPSAPKRVSGRHDPLRPPHQINRRLSRHVSDAVMHAMARFPQERYPNAEAFKRDLLGAPPLYLLGAAAYGLLRGHTGYVYSVAWSPDGQTVASGSEDRTIRLWRSSDGTPLGVLHDHAEKVGSVAWSPDGRRLAAGVGDGTLRLWCAAERRPEATLRGHGGPVASVAWSPDGQTIASGGGDGTVRIWSAADGALLSEIHSGDRVRVYSVAWRPDGQILAAGCSDGIVRLWHIGEPVTLHTLPGHTKFVQCVAWSPDGQALASAGADKTVRLWQLANGRLISTLRQHRRWAANLAWSAVGKLGGRESDEADKMWMWRLSDGSLCYVLQGHTSFVYSVAWSPDGQTVASGGADATVRLWRADGTSIDVLIGHSDWVNSVAWSPDGQAFASGGLDGVVRLWRGK